jgi:hypothetical protein
MLEGGWGVMGRRTLRTDYDLPQVSRDHYAAPRLTEGQGLEVLRAGRQLQEAAVLLDPQHARAHSGALRRRRVVRLAVVVFALEIAASIAVIGQALEWWPT